MHMILCSVNLSVNLEQVVIASGEKYMETVREAQKSIDLPNVVCVDANGVETWPR